MNWYIVDKGYVNYLHSIDSRVQNIEYSQKLKPYIGIVLEIYDFKYYVPISSTKQKYYDVKANIDLYKIKSNDKILGVLNLNNMIPIKEEYIKRLKYSEIEQYRRFENKIDKEKYINLLNIELHIINKEQEQIKRNAEELYQYIIKRPNSNIAKRCCNFKLLEEKILDYKTEEKC